MSVKILVADDSPISRAILQRMLRELECEVVVAVDGTEAWSIISGEERPPIVLLDWMMPGMNGVDICQKIREEQGDGMPYVILLSANTESAHIVEGLNAGANDYLSKPYNNAELIARIRAGMRVVDLNRQRAECKSALVDAMQRIYDLESAMPLCKECSQPIEGASAQTQVDQYQLTYPDARLGSATCARCQSDQPAV